MKSLDQILDEARKLGNGVSMWNAKTRIPQAFRLFEDIIRHLKALEDWRKSQEQK